MNSFTEPLRIKRDYLPKATLQTVDNLLDQLARHCADKFEESLMKNDKRLTPGDYEELVRHLKHEADITLSMSVKITEKKMDEEWMIFPVDFEQRTFADFSPKEERDLRKAQVAELNDSLQKRKQAAAEQAGGE